MEEKREGRGVLGWLEGEGLEYVCVCVVGEKELCVSSLLAPA